MRTSPSIFVVGEVGGVDRLRRAHLEPSADIVHINDFEAYIEQLRDSEPWLVITAAALPDGTSGTEVLREAKAYCPYLSVIMVARPAQVNVIVEACEHGLDEHLVCGDDTSASASLLIRQVRRCIQNYTPPASSLGPDIQVALQQAVYHDLEESVVLVNAKGRVLYFNKTAQDLALELYDRPLAVGVSLYSFVPEADDGTIADAVRRYVQQAFDGKKSVICQPVAQLDRKAQVRKYRYTPVYGPNGDIMAVCASSRDLEEVIEVERKLEETEKMRVVGQLAGGIAHDFNNLLTIINSYTYYALKELSEDSKLAFALDKVVKAAERGSKLIDQLLAFSRRHHTEPRLIDLNEVVEELDKMLQRVVGEGIELQAELRAERATVFVDGTQLEQVILNLVLNACDAMDGSGKLRIRTSRRDIDRPRQTSIEPIPTGTYVLLEVVDTGHGIDEETLEHIFEPFFTTKEVGKGTGLGLSSTWGIVKQAGGFISVDSLPGKGATFSVYLPEGQ